MDVMCLKGAMLRCRNGFSRVSERGNAEVVLDFSTGCFCECARLTGSVSDGILVLDFAVASNCSMQAQVCPRHASGVSNLFMKCIGDETSSRRRILSFRATDNAALGMVSRCCRFPMRQSWARELRAQASRRSARFAKPVATLLLRGARACLSCKMQGKVGGFYSGSW